MLVKMDICGFSIDPFMYMACYFDLKQNLDECEIKSKYTEKKTDFDYQNITSIEKSLSNSKPKKKKSKFGVRLSEFH